MRFAAVLLMVFACTKNVPPPSDTPAPAPAPAAASPLPMADTPHPPPAPVTNGPRVIFPDGFTVSVEIAADDDTRAQGLMFRDHLEPGTGMLFLFPEDGDYPFWMKNTRIPLDMLWIDSSQKVAHVKFNVPPCVISDCPNYPPNVTARYVLEVAGGVALQHHVKAGDQLRFEKTSDIVAK
jgi:uncharacterized membrane protein (UPF0127 family)